MAASRPDTVVDVSVDGVVHDYTGLQADAATVLNALYPKPAELSILLCTDERIRTLNDQWRGKNTPTDVLSFPQDDPIVLGDVIISMDTAERQAAEHGHNLALELRILLIHGICHLLGYDHIEPQERLEMQQLEQRGLDALGLGAHGLVHRAEALGVNLG